jgi:hypothetical protein
MSVIRCDRCGRLFDLGHDDRNDWNVIARQGEAVGYLCPDCQTPEENAEAEIRAATLDYDTDAEGRIVGRVKLPIPELDDGQMRALTDAAEQRHSNARVWVAGRRVAPADLRFAVLTADEDGDVIGQVLFAIDASGPFAFTPIEPRPESSLLARFVENVVENWRDWEDNAG